MNKINGGKPKNTWRRLKGTYLRPDPSARHVGAAEIKQGEEKRGRGIVPSSPEPKEEEGEIQTEQGN